MTNSQNTKRALLASILSVVLCAAMLVGSTFAWFTDSVTSAGNIIKSGSLKVAMDWADGKEELTTTEWKDASEGAIFNYDLWEPGYTEVRHVRISNVGSLALKYEIRIAATGEVNELADVIDVYYIKDGKQIAGRANLIDAEKIGTLSEILAKPYVAKGHILGKKGETVFSDVATIALKMQESAGNDYQDMSIGSEFAVQLVATQYTYENDSFGNDYDKEATLDFVPVGTSEELKEIAQNGGAALLTENIAFDDTVEFAKDAVLDLNGKTISVNNSKSSLKAGVGKSLTVQGNGKIEGVLYADSKFGNGGTLIIDGGENFEVYSDTANGWAVYGGAGSTIKINGGTYTSSQKGGVINTAGSGTLEVKNATINVEANSVMNAFGIYSGYDNILLENVTINAKYSRALHLLNANGNTVIRGGTFITNMESEGLLSPTIEYQGTLDISNASITRIGTGIKFTKTWPTATEVEGLTCTDCTFTAVGDNNTYNDIDFSK